MLILLDTNIFFCFLWRSWWGWWGWNTLFKYVWDARETFVKSVNVVFSYEMSFIMQEEESLNTKAHLRKECVLLILVFLIYHPDIPAKENINISARKILNTHWNPLKYPLNTLDSLLKQSWNYNQFSKILVTVIDSFSLWQKKCNIRLCLGIIAKLRIWQASSNCISECGTPSWACFVLLLSLYSSISFLTSILVKQGFLVQRISLQFENHKLEKLGVYKIFLVF